MALDCVETRPVINELKYCLEMLLCACWPQLLAYLPVQIETITSVYPDDDDGIYGNVESFFSFKGRGPLECY